MLPHAAQNRYALNPPSDYYTDEAKGPLLDKVFSMRYRSYSDAGHIDKCSTGKFMDEYDVKPNTQSFLLYGEAKKTVGSIRICDYGENEGFGAPSMEMYGDEIMNKVGYDKRFIEANRFVIDPAYQKRGGKRARFRIFERVVDMAMDYNADSILIAVRPEHVKFYGMLYFKPISEAKVYHGVKFKTVLCVNNEILRFKEFVHSKLHRVSNESALNNCAN